MDIIFEIIKNFKKEESRSFKLLNRKYELEDEPKTLRLFDFIKNESQNTTNKEIDESLIINELFPNVKGNLNAYYRLKNRLKTDMEKALLNLHHDIDDKISLMNLINLANIFSYKSAYSIAVQYLKKAEKIAEKAEMYDILEIVYNELISLSHEFDEIDPQEYTQKYRLNSIKKQVGVDIDFAIAVLKNKLRKINFSHTGKELIDELQSVVNELNIATDVHNTPKMKLKVHVTLRDLILHRGDFVGLEHYLVASLKEFETSQIFSKSTHASKINLLAWIINTYTINNKHDLALVNINLLLEELNKYNKLYYEQHIWTYYQSLMTNYMSSGKIDEAITLMENIKDLPQHKGVTFYDFGININLIMSYHFKEKVSAAIKTLNSILSKEKFGKYSTENQFSLALLEIVLHFDNNNFDYVDYKIQETKTKYKNLLKRIDFQEDKLFLKHLSTILSKPSGIKDKSTKILLEAYTSDEGEVPIGGARHINYKFWIKSKLINKPYYELLKEKWKPNS